MIAIHNLTYNFPNQKLPALRAINWHVETGEFVLVTGPSGSGKSTLLRCLNGLVPHFTGGSLSGVITINGQDALQVGPHVLSRDVGFVQQNPEAQAVLDRVEPEIAFGMENAALPPQEMRVRMEEVLSLLDLVPLRDRTLTTLSGGERQRVAIASALVLRPQILVLDEPTSQLDPQSAEEVLRALVRLNEDLGLTIILAEHRLERVLRYVDRITYLQDGALLVDEQTRTAVTQLPLLPPLAQLSRALDWQPTPLTIKEGRPFARRYWQNAAPLKPIQNGAVNKSIPLLSVQNITFSYNGHQTLKGVSLAIKPGETVALMGRNGAGKSTLLKCVMGLLAPESGTITINSRGIHGRHVAEISREAAYLPQNPDDLLYAETVSEELTATLRNHQMLQRNGVAAMLDQLGLADVAGSYPRDLSVGQRQRVALGAVTITQPNLLLLDEPTRGLDYVAKKALLAIWEKWLAAGMGLLLVTHDVELVAQIANRVLIMSQGEIIAAGETATVLGTSPLFAPQISRLFPSSNWLTVADALGTRITR